MVTLYKSSNNWLYQKQINNVLWVARGPFSIWSQPWVIKSEQHKTFKSGLCDPSPMMRVCTAIVFGQYLVFQMSCGEDLGPDLLSGLSSALGLKRLAIICKSVKLILMSWCHKKKSEFAGQRTEISSRLICNWERQCWCRTWKGCWPMTPSATSSIGAVESSVQRKSSIFWCCQIFS